MRQLSVLSFKFCSYSPGKKYLSFFPVCLGGCFKAWSSWLAVRLLLRKRGLLTLPGTRLCASRAPILSLLLDWRPFRPPPPDLAFNDRSGMWELSPGRCSLECRTPATNEARTEAHHCKGSSFLCPDPTGEVNVRMPDGQDCWGAVQAPGFACGTCTEQSAGRLLFVCVRCPLLLPLSRLISTRGLLPQGSAYRIDSSWCTFPLFPKVLSETRRQSLFSQGGFLKGNISRHFHS